MRKEKNPSLLPQLEKQREGAKREIKGSLNELIFKTGRILMMIYFVN